MYDARVSAKYGGITYIDYDKEEEEGESVGKIGAFRGLDFAVLTKIRRGGADATSTVTIIYEGFEKRDRLQGTRLIIHNMWERE